MLVESIDPELRVDSTVQARVQENNNADCPTNGSPYVDGSPVVSPMSPPSFL